MRIREMYLELLFLTVLALPNASRTGFDCKKGKIEYSNDKIRK